MASSSQKMYSRFIGEPLNRGLSPSLVDLNSGSIDGQPQILGESLVLVHILCLKEGGGKGRTLFQQGHVLDLCLRHTDSLQWNILAQFLIDMYGAIVALTIILTSAQS